MLKSLQMQKILHSLHQMFILQIIFKSCQTKYYPFFYNFVHSDGKSLHFEVALLTFLSAA